MRRLVAGGLRAQATQAGLKAVVELAGGTAADLLGLTWYLMDGADGRSFMEDAVEVMAAKEAVMPGVRPATTAGRNWRPFLTPDLEIEIQAVAGTERGRSGGRDRDRGRAGRP